MKRTTRKLGLAAASLIASLQFTFVACSGEESSPAQPSVAPVSLAGAAARGGREVVYPLAAFRSEHADRVAFSAGQRTHLIDLDGKLERAIVVSHVADGFIEYDVAEFAGGRLVGGIATKGKRDPDRAQTVTFRIALTNAGKSELLLERTLSLGARENFDLPIPAKIASGGRLVLRVESVDSKGLQALWVDPFLRKRREATPPGPAGRPNVLVITSDTTRQDELSVYEGPAATPTLEALAADGVRFTQAYSVAFGTTPSHSSLMTSLHAAKHAVYNNKIVLGSQFETLAEVLGAEGYSTSAFVSAMPLARSLGLAQGFDLYDDVFPVDDESMLGRYARHERRAGRTVDLFSDWLDERGDSAVPFFSWLHFFDAHQPYVPPASAYAPVSPSSPADPESYFVDEKGEPLHIDTKVLLRDKADEFNDVATVARSRYRAEIEYLDSQLDRLIETLRARGLYDSTLIVFLADHGENFLDHSNGMAFNHAGLYRDTSQIPLIVKLPESRGAGTTRDDLVASIDVVPTVARVVGATPRPEWQGQDVFDEADPRDHLIIEGMGPQEVAVRTPGWLYRAVSEPWSDRPDILQSLGYEKGQPYQLFDLAADPSEAMNVYDRDHPALPELTNWLAGFVAADSDGGDAEVIVDPNHIEALRNLGYVE